MPSIEDIVAARGLGGATPEMPPEQPVQEEPRGLGFDFSFLLKPTGAGPIENYLDHPLNAKRSRGLAQALRGATGLFGEGLRAALADILFGSMEYMRERRVEAAADATN